MIDLVVEVAVLLCWCKEIILLWSIVFSKKGSSNTVVPLPNGNRSSASNVSTTTKTRGTVIGFRRYAIAACDSLLTL